MNTFNEFEPETLSAVDDGRALNNIIPPILPIGPLQAFELKNDQDKYYLSWLDNQPKESVVYVSFGSRTAMSDSQIRELSKGLDGSGYRFLWVLKTSKVDRDDTQEVKDMVGESFIERTKNKGIVMKGWVRPAGHSAASSHWWVCESLRVELGYGRSPGRDTSAGVAATRGSKREC